MSAQILLVVISPFCWPRIRSSLTLTFPYRDIVAWYDWSSLSRLAAHGHPRFATNIGLRSPPE